MRKLESKLMQLEQANRALAVRSAVIESSTGGIALGDLDGRCTYANRSLCRMLGAPADELVGRSIDRLFPDPAAGAAIGAAVSASRTWVGQIRPRRGEGVGLVLQVLLETVKDADGAPLCLMLSCMDVSALARTQEELQRVRRLESLSIFSRSVAHDLNNLLMGMLANVELGVRALSPDSAARRHLQNALVTAERVRGLTTRMRSLARGRSSERVAVNVRELLEQCAAWSLAGSDAHLEVSEEPGTGKALADPHALDQVFGNLLINAREAMPGGGTVHARIASRTRRTKLNGRTREIEVTVRDEGPGIPREHAKAVFDPFFTTKEHGSGLGLATCYWILKDHGGDIALDPAHGAVGAAFVVRLPAFVEDEAPPREPRQG